MTPSPDALRAMLSAKDGEWRTVKFASNKRRICDDHSPILVGMGYASDNAVAELACAAVNSLPAHLSELEAMRGALRDAEWSAREWCGAGAPMHMQGPEYGCGTWDPCCPVCRGIKPGSSNGWTASAYGHKPGCKIDAALSKAAGGGG